MFKSDCVTPTTPPYCTSALVSSLIMPTYVTSSGLQGLLEPHFLPSEVEIDSPYIMVYLQQPWQNTQT